MADCDDCYGGNDGRDQTGKEASLYGLLREGLSEEATSELRREG